MKRTRTDPPIVAPFTGATLGVGSDCYPYTVVKQLGGKGTRLLVIRDEAIVTGGPYEYGDPVTYDIMPGAKEGDVVAPEECEVAVWRPTRGRFTVGGSPLGIGHRRRYHDPSY